MEKKMNNHMFYGIPQIIWDNLCEKAEEILYEDSLGNHIVGIYPAGNRIYGIESQSPGLMCLYVDTVEPMIDPLSNYHQYDGFRYYSIGNSSSPIVMVDLYKWVRWVFNDKDILDWKTYSFLNLIPFGNHVIHEDESISEIMKQCYKGLKERNFIKYRDFNYFGDVGRCGPTGIYPSRYLYLRTCLMTNMSEYFNPNINPQWDIVQEFSQTNKTISQKIDKAAREEVLLDNSMNGSDRVRTANSLMNNAVTFKESHTSKKTLEEISKAVMNFYRFQL
jgi:hypothetical protein